MKTVTPPKPVGDSPKWTFRRWIWDLLAGGQFPIKGDGTVKVEWLGGFYRISAKPGGSSGISGHRWAAAGILYDHTKSYTGSPQSGEEVWVQASNPLCDLSGDGTVDPDTGVAVFAIPGLWRCLRPTAPVVNPTGRPAGTYYYIPHLPMPTDDDPTATNNHWLLVAPANPCY